MSTLNDVQNAMVNLIDAAFYPNGDLQPSAAGSTITQIVVNTPGTGYTQATVSIAGGTGAVAFANIVNGGIASISLQDGGCTFTGAPAVTIMGDGMGATATAIVLPITVYTYAGDPLKQNLDAQLKARNIINIAVFEANGMTRNTTRFNRRYELPIINLATLTLAVAGKTVTVGGMITANESAMVIVNGTGYAHKVLSNDTVNTIASALAALIPGASAVNNVVTIPSAYRLIARVSTQGTARRILHSQESIVRARVIAPTNSMREWAANTLQIALGENDYWLTMPDSVNAFIKPKGIQENNQYELSQSFVRDYLYLVEYHTVQVGTFQTVADVALDEGVQQLPLS